MSCVLVLSTHLIEIFPLSPGKPRTGSPDRQIKLEPMSASFCTKDILQLRNAIAHGSATLGKICCLLYSTEEQKTGK